MTLLHRKFLWAGTVLLLGAGIAAYALQGADRALPPGELARALVADVPVTPHRALYEMHLSDAEGDSNINNVGGKMLFAWTDACEGWTIEQRLDLAFTYNGGAKQRVRTSMASWEAKDGSAFHFNVRRSINNKDKEVYQGLAKLVKDGSGKATYTSPEGKQLELSPRTLFPTLHTLQILKAAKAGQHQVNASVFDGADEQGLNAVSAFIGNEQKITAPEGTPQRELRSGRAWPVQMAFFAPDNKTGTPDYEMHMTLLENGVANDLLIDYGDFTVSATLHDIEPMAKPAC